MATTPFLPSWKKFEKDLHSDDADTALKASIAFEETRNLELKTSQLARQWEKDRKNEWAKNKPEWKRKKIQEEHEQELKIIHELREGGYLMGGLRPAAGLLLVQKTEKKEETQGGIFLPDNVEYESNLAVVKRAGDSAHTPYGEIKPPAKEGETVLFRKGAGLNVKINGQPHLIIRFDEVFGTVEES